MQVIFNGSLKSTKIVSKVEKFPYLTISFSPVEKVSDEVRGVLIYRAKKWFFISVNQYINTKTNINKIKQLALILESPHKDEYFHNIPIRPANGRTGDRIEAKIGDRAYNRWNLPKNFDYVVHIMNAVQYQCSCYKVLHDFYSSESHTNRNQVFKLLFGNNGFKLNRDFIDRLENLSPYYVINCVTKQLKKTVGDEMKNNYSLYNKNKYEEDDHPSCWK